MPKMTNYLDNLKKDELNVAINSAGIYAYDEDNNVIGFWTSIFKKDKAYDFIIVCIVPINSPFNEDLVEAVKQKLTTYKNILRHKAMRGTI